MAAAGCTSSAVPILSPWPFKEDQVRISCERIEDPKTGAAVAYRVFVEGSDGVRYAANEPAREVAPYMTPLLAEPDRDQVARRQGIQLCEMQMAEQTFRRSGGLLGESSWLR